MAARTTPVPLLSDLRCPSGRRPAAHLVGIGGSGMKALAELLAGLGWKVSGSDLRPSHVLEQMRRLGLQVVAGPEVTGLPHLVDVLVYSPAVGDDDQERLEAGRRSVPQLSLPEMLGALMDDRTGVAVTGTHGKSTTTAMVGTVLRRAGLSPSVAVGAELCDSGRSGWAGSSDLLVVEGCEYRRNFLSLRPKHAAVLNVEADHFDCYNDVSDVAEAFAEFTSRLPDDGVLVARADCMSAVSARRSDSRIITFSMDEGADYRAADLRRVAGGTRFRVFRGGNYLAEMSLRLPGLHNVINALAATALCHELGVGAGDIREGLWEFQGVRRRFETVGSWRGRLLIDDYAHHPTAVRAVLKTARAEHPRRRIWCSFQPHQVSRTVALMPEFASALALADGVIVLPVFAAREMRTDSPQGSTGSRKAADVAKELTSAVAALGTQSQFLPSLDLLPDAMDHVTRPGDVFLTMGAGNIDQVHHEFSRRLRRNHAAG